MTDSRITIGLAQIAPAWLQRDATITKVVSWIGDAAAQGCDLVVFGEALVPGYPFWVERTGGAQFESQLQKELFAHYVSQGVCIEDGDLEPVCKAAAKNGIAVYVGIMERAANRGRHSLYCTIVYIDKSGTIGSAHRKLMPTHEERLVWAIGDGHGLRTHRLGPFTVGGLNCWENWLPLPRAALYAQGESRSFVVSVSGLMRKTDIDASLPHADLLLETADELMANGGSCVAAPDGSWLLEPVTGGERLEVVEIDHARVLEERHSLDVGVRGRLSQYKQRHHDERTV